MFPTFPINQPQPPQITPFLQPQQPQFNPQFQTPEQKSLT